MVTRDIFFLKTQFLVARACVSSELCNWSVFSSHSSQIPIIHSFYAQWPPLVITSKIFYIIFMRFWPLIIRPFFMIFQFFRPPQGNSMQRVYNTYRECVAPTHVRNWTVYSLLCHIHLHLAFLIWIEPPDCNFQYHCVMSTQLL